MNIPNWAVRDDTARSLFPAEGFFQEYLRYAERCTDAPLIFHLGTILPIISCAAGECMLKVEAEREPEQAWWTIPLMFWSMIIGNSTDSRKSNAMGRGMARARQAMRVIQERENFQLPSEGSIELFTEHMSVNPTALFFHTEIASVFEMTRRGYMDGLKTWMMEMYEGDYYERRTLRTHFIIERPRLNVLGGIPPDTFKEQTGRTDWRTGFLTRFTFWPGYREHRLRTPRDDPQVERDLARWLSSVAAHSKGTIIIPYDEMLRIDEWNVTFVEQNREKLPEEVLSHHLRLGQEAAYRMIALFSLSLLTTPLRKSATLITPAIMTTQTLKVLDALRESSLALYANSLRSHEREQEDIFLHWLKAKGKIGASSQEISSEFGWTTRQRQTWLKTLIEGGEIRLISPILSHIGEKKRGRPQHRWAIK